VTQKEEETPGGIQAVAVAFDILEELSRSSAPIGVTELARRLGQTKARVHRHLTTLRTLGFVSKDEASDRYQLGWKIYRLGMSVAENFGLRRLAHRHIQRVSDETGQTAMLAMPANTEVIVIDAVQSNNAVAVTIRPGAVIPANSSALGRVILAFESEAVRSLALSRPMSRLTEDSLIDRTTVERQLETIRSRWFEVAVNERLIGIAALAAPVFDDRNQIVASVGLIGSQSVISHDPAPSLVRQVQDAARRISDELHSTAWQTRQYAGIAGPLPR
jgi:DNA-binding IclR family transcriptional regulator